MLIGQIAKLSGTGIETIRFYEKEGLITPKARKDSGYRIYDHSTLERLSFIKRAKGLGFSLKETKALLAISTESNPQRALVREKTLEKIHDIDQKISDLKSMRDVLASLLRSCEASSANTACPILESLRKPENSANSTN